MKYKLIASVLSLAALFSSCSQSLLDIPQKGVVATENFYITDEDATEALNNAYARFGEQLTRGGGAISHSPYIVLYNLPGDDIYSAGAMYGATNSRQQVNEFRATTDNEIYTQMYKAFYRAIYHSNLVINNFEYGDSDIKDKAISEARVLRAFCHMMLALGWGQPPLVTEVLTGDAKPGNYPGTQAELLQWCADECEEVLPYLDERESPQDKNGAVKVTKGFALTIIGKALLFAGDYEGARAALKQVIDSGKYQLVPGNRIRESFHIEGDGNEEKIFECNLALNSSLTPFSYASKSLWQHNMTWNWNLANMAGTPLEIFNTGWGGLGVREDFAADFVANDGDSYRRKAWIVSFDELIEELSYSNDAEVDDKWTDPNRGIKEPGLYANGYYLSFKRNASREDEYNNSFNMTNFLIFRYAEVLLMYAECQAVLGDTDGSGLKALNDIQNRAGSKHVSTACTLDEVKNEKRFEMWLEGCRWLDMVRWGDLDGVMNSGKNIPTLHDAFFADGEPRHRAYITHGNPNEGIAETGFVKGKHELFPYPFSETSINPNIVQNPGWDK